LKKWDLKDCVAISIRETGLSIIYTSVILFFIYSPNKINTCRDFSLQVY
jgi:hypothetical protein